jgi:hypothetical protein
LSAVPSAKNNVREESPQERPLRHSALTAAKSCGGSSLGDGTGIEHRGRARGRRANSRYRRFDRCISQHDRADTHEVESAQERIEAELARPAEIDEKLGCQFANLRKLTRELVRWSARRLASLALEDIQTSIGERLHETAQRLLKPSRLCLGPSGLAVGHEGQRRAQHLLRLVRREVAHVLGEPRKLVRSREYDVHGQADPELL